jgi:hypothetical protein
MDSDPDDQLMENLRAPSNEVYLRWISLQTSHLLALGTVSRAFIMPSTVVPVVSLLAANYPPKPQKMELWMAIIDRVFKQFFTGINGFNAQLVKTAIHAYTDPSKKPRKPHWHSVFASFYPIHSNQPIAFGNPALHYKALLASLMLAAHTQPPKGQPEVAKLLQVTYPLPNHYAHHS